MGTRSLFTVFDLFRLEIFLRGVLFKLLFGRSISLTLNDNSSTPGKDSKECLGRTEDSLASREVGR